MRRLLERGKRAMSWPAESTVEIRCPRCGGPVQVPVEFTHVDIVWHTKTTYTLRAFFKQQINVEGHKCRDGLQPIERFVGTGALDDTKVAPS